MGKPAKNREVELKLEIEKSDAGLVWQRAISAGIADSEPAARQLRSIYYDTPDLALHKNGVSLRLREAEGAWTQTVKLDASLFGGLSSATEVSNPICESDPDPTSIPDVAAKETVLRLVGSTPLSVICETLIERREGEVVGARGTRALLTVDSGKIVAGNRNADICELEIEHLDGPQGGLFDLAKIVLPPGPIRFSMLSKGNRGFLLATQGRASGKRVPRNAQTVCLDKSLSVDTAAKSIFRECAAQITSNVNVVLESTDPEGPHQLRIGLRRLRTALSIFAPHGKSTTGRKLADEARWLGREVGNLRDLDVIGCEIAASEMATEPQIPELAEMLAKRVDEVRAELHRILTSAHVRGFLLDLTGFIETEYQWNKKGRKGSVPLPAFSRARLKMRVRKIQKQIGELSDLTVEQQHELRKELKKLRYTIEFLAPLYKKKKVKPYLSRLKKLQEAFGTVNDFEVTRDLLGRLCGAGPVGADVQTTIDRIIERRRTEAVRARKRSAALARKFANAERFWM